MIDLGWYAEEFDRCALHINRAIEASPGLYDLEDVRNACLAGHMQLWPGERSAAVTEIVHYPAKTGLIVAFAGGDVDELKQMMPKIRDFAARNGCDFLATMGRRGWARKLGVGRVVSTMCMEDL